MISWLHCYGLVARQNIMVVEACDREGCSSYISQEAEKEKGRGKDKVCLSKLHPSDHFFQPALSAHSA
jgi:hypothetical protein